MAEAVKIKLPAAKKCLLMMLANYADENGTCYPAVGTLALDAGMSPRSVQNYLQDFVELGLISIRARKTESGSATSNLYVLSLQNAPQVKKPRNTNKHRGANPAPHPAPDAPQGAADAGEGRKSCGEGVQDLQGTGGAAAAPNTVSKPITEPVIEPVTPPSSDSARSVQDIDQVMAPEDLDRLFGASLSVLDDSQPDQPVPERLPVDTRRFEMHWEWQPGPQFAARCTQLGVSLARIPTDQADLILGEFRSYWADRPDRNTSGAWEHKLATRLAHSLKPRHPAANQTDLTTPQNRRHAVSAAVMDIRDTDW